VNVAIAIYRDGTLEEAADEVFTVAVVESHGPPVATERLPAPTPATPGFPAAMALGVLLVLRLRR